MISQIPMLFGGLDDKIKHKLLQILIDRIKFDATGRIVDRELNRPFGYLSKLARNPTIKLNGHKRFEAGPLWGTHSEYSSMAQQRWAFSL